MTPIHIKGNKERQGGMVPLGVQRDQLSENENTGYIYCDTDADSGICNVIVLTIFSVVISCDFGSNV